MAELFSTLDGVSPWWWAAAALAIGAVELLTGTYFMLWIALAAASVALVMWGVPDLMGTAQIGIFAILLLVYTVVGWRFMGRFGKSPESTGLNNRAAALIGRRVVAVEQFSGGTGAVEIDGIRWRGRLRARDDKSQDTSASDPTPGSELTVVGADGMTLMLEKE